MSYYYYFFRLTQGEGFLNDFIDMLKFQVQNILNLGNRLTRNSKIKKYYKSNDKIRIQFGSGSKTVEGFLNTDFFGRIPVNITKKLPFPSNSVDLIYSHGVVEHIYNRQFKFFLRESFRVLKKGGIQIIITPSLERIIETIYGKSDSKREYLRSHENLPDHRQLGGKLDAATFLNRMMHVYYLHRWIYDYESIKRLAISAKYSEVKVISPEKIPDENIKKQILKRANKFTWKGEMEIYALIK